MPVVRLLYGFLVLALVGALAQGHAPPKSNTDLIINKKYGFSVVRPRNWFVLLTGDTPVFFTYGPEAVPPDASVPPGGASIWLRAGSLGPLPAPTTLSAWAQKVVAEGHGSDAREHSIEGPGVPGLQVVFLQLPLGSPGDVIKDVVLAWKWRNTIYGAQLTYHDGDPRSDEYEKALVELMRSFKPL
jgi:hypothetical protein